MTFQLQIDKNSFQSHILYIGMNPLKKDASTRTKEDMSPSSVSISTWITAPRKPAKLERTPAVLDGRYREGVSNRCRVSSASGMVDQSGATTICCYPFSTMRAI